MSKIPVFEEIDALLGGGAGGIGSAGAIAAIAEIGGAGITIAKVAEIAEAIKEINRSTAEPEFKSPDVPTIGDTQEILLPGGGGGVIPGTDDGGPQETVDQGSDGGAARFPRKANQKKDGDIVTSSHIIRWSTIAKIIANSFFPNTKGLTAAIRTMGRANPGIVSAIKSVIASTKDDKSGTQTKGRWFKDVLSSISQSIADQIKALLTPILGVPAIADVAQPAAPSSSSGEEIIGTDPDGFPIFKPGPPGPRAEGRPRVRPVLPDEGPEEKVTVPEPLPGPIRDFPSPEEVDIFDDLRERFISSDSGSLSDVSEQSLPPLSDIDGDPPAIARDPERAARVASWIRQTLTNTGRLSAGARARVRAALADPRVRAAVKAGTGATSVWGVIDIVSRILGDGPGGTLEGPRTDIGDDGDTKVDDKTDDKEDEKKEEVDDDETITKVSVAKPGDQFASDAKPTFFQGSSEQYGETPEEAMTGKIEFARSDYITPFDLTNPLVRANLLQQGARFLEPLDRPPAKDVKMAEKSLEQSLRMILGIPAVPMSKAPANLMNLKSDSNFNQVVNAKMVSPTLEKGITKNGFIVPMPLIEQIKQPDITKVDVQRYVRYKVNQSLFDNF